MLLCLSMASCSEDNDETRHESPVTIGRYLQVISDDGTTVNGAAHWLVFNGDDRLTEYRRYASVSQLCSAFVPTGHGPYLYMLVTGIGDQSFDSDLTDGMPLADVFRLLDLLSDVNPDMRTGWTRTTWEEGVSDTCTVILRKGVSRPTTLRLHIQLPEDMLHVGNDGRGLRCVTEVYGKGGGARLMHSVLTPVAEDGARRYTVDIEYLEQQDYDVLVWCDYVPGNGLEDHYYLTSSLRNVAINQDVPYVAGDTGRRAYYAHFTANLLLEGVTEKDVVMASPFAAYTLVASDAARYEEMQAVNGLPGYEDIGLKASYTGFFPCAFDVWDGVPVDAMAWPAVTAKVAKTAGGNILLCSDYIFAGKEPSFTSLSFTLTDKRTENVLSQVEDVRIYYIQGELTVVDGEYLTAGTSSDGVSVDDRWDGEIDIEF